tara:strand:+ start:203 stop:457 length:255 start_codon:yes stop_codon:yes gene_type:complete
MEHTKQWVKDNDPYGEEFVDINQSYMEPDYVENSTPKASTTEQNRWKQILSGIPVNKKGNISYEEFKSAALYVKLEESMIAPPE